MGGIGALYAFCMTRPAVKATVPATTISWSVRIRALEAGPPWDPTEKGISVDYPPLRR